MGKFIDLQPGERFDRLTVVAFSHVKNTKRFYLCRCDCGTEKAVQVGGLRGGTTRSCGCLQREKSSKWAAELGRETKIRKRLEGQRFGRWTVIELVPKRLGSSGPRWLCRCDCGTSRVLPGNTLRSGTTQSCGCLRAEMTAARCLKHGNARAGEQTREFRIWLGMWTRCTNPRRASWKNYGGRGIKVCDRWKDFANFLEDMGTIPAPLSIDRIDNDGDYEPGNCRVATSSEQASNRRPKSTYKN